jgi:uncharacterized iron-regulated protein
VAQDFKKHSRKTIAGIKSEEHLPRLGASRAKNRALPRTADATTEREIVTAQLKELALAHQHRPISEWIDTLATWHQTELEKTRANSWTSGLLRNRDPFVVTAVDRFHTHQMKNAMEQLTAEAHSLRLKLLVALACVNFYAKATANNGLAKATLEKLAGLPEREQGESSSTLPLSNIQQQPG